MKLFAGSSGCLRKRPACTGMRIQTGTVLGRRCHEQGTIIDYCWIRICGLPAWRRDCGAEREGGRKGDGVEVFFHERAGGSVGGSSASGEAARSHLSGRNWPGQEQPIAGGKNRVAGKVGSACGMVEQPGNGGTGKGLFVRIAGRKNRRLRPLLYGDGVSLVRPLGKTGGVGEIPGESRASGISGLWPDVGIGPNSRICQPGNAVGR